MKTMRYTETAEKLVEKIATEFQWGLVGGARQPAPRVISSHDNSLQCVIAAMGEYGLKELPVTRILKDDNVSFSDLQDKDMDVLPNIFDLLAEYRCPDPCKEGEIILYESRISRYQSYLVCRYYCMSHRSSGDKPDEFDVHDQLRQIVTLHATAHWIIHWMMGSDGNWWDHNSYRCNKTLKELHEGLAQLFTCYAMINMEDDRKRDSCLSLFSSMLRGQAPCYLQHYCIFGHKNFSWRGCLVALQGLRKMESQENITLDYFLAHLNPRAI